MSSERTNQKPKLLRVSLREECRKMLMEMVIKGHFQEEERLNETNIAKELGVSQTPVRESLVALECQGFVTFYPNRGFVVKPFTREEGHDLYNAIAELEAIALLGSVWPNEDILEKAQELNNQFKQAKDPEERVEIDVELHDLLISQTSNQYLRELISLTKQRVFRYEWNFMSGSIEESTKNHDDIISALNEGNVKQAIKILKKNNLIGLPQLDIWLSNRTKK